MRKERERGEEGYSAVLE